MTIRKRIWIRIDGMISPICAQTGKETEAMKILVLSDSHAALSFMRRCITSVSPDVLIHLGDYFDDGLAMKEQFPGIPFYQVPGNCDCYRCPPGQPEILVLTLDGVNLYMTHGHKHRVKSGLSLLLQDARASGSDIVLYGHTHRPDCHREEDGLWVLNPGTCGFYGGSAGLLELHDGGISECRLLRDGDLV